jgi:hypothetical protein
MNPWLIAGIVILIIICVYVCIKFDINPIDIFD